MRTTTTASLQRATLSGEHSLAPVAGRQIELLGDFTVGNAPCGFHFLKSGDRKATLSYDPATGILALDYTTLARVATDGGRWAAALPKKVSTGETLRLHLFLDGSIADIFVNDAWAFSVRLFPTDEAAAEAEVFADAPTVATVSGWVLNPQQATDGIGAVQHSALSAQRCTDLLGRHLSGAQHKGLYILNGRKYVGR